MNTRMNLLLAGAAVMFASESASGSGAPAAKVKTVADDMDARRIFADVESAGAYLNLCAETLSDFGAIPLAGAGIDSEGNFDPEVYHDGMDVMVATLRKAKGGVKAIVVAPVPKLDTLLADESGKAWAQRILQKEYNHVAVRALREAEDISTVVDQMPTTRDAYIASARDGGTGIMATFDELFKGIIATVAAKVPTWAKARLTKGELKKAMESKGYALEYYPALEDRGDKESLFVLALNLGIGAATKKGLDPTIFQRWLDTRASKTFTAGTDEDAEDDFDVDSLTESLLAEPAPAADASAETPAA